MTGGFSFDDCQRWLSLIPTHYIISKNNVASSHLINVSQQVFIGVINATSDGSDVVLQLCFQRTLSGATAECEWVFRLYYHFYSSRHTAHDYYWRCLCVSNILGHDYYSIYLLPRFATELSRALIQKASSIFARKVHRPPYRPSCRSKCRKRRRAIIWYIYSRLDDMRERYFVGRIWYRPIAIMIE